MIKRVIKEYIELFQEKNYSRVSSSIAFFMVLNGIPTLFLVFLFLSNLDFSYNLHGNENLMPGEIINVLQLVIENSQNINGTDALTFTISAMFGSSNLFVQLKKVGERIYGYKDQKKPLRKKIVSILISGLFIILVVGLLLLVVILQNVSKLIEINFVIRKLNLLLLWFMIFSIIVYLNKFVAPQRVSLKRLLRGSTFTFVFWVIGSVLFSIYINNISNFNKFYGSVSILIIFLIWIYFIAQGLIIGFFINYKYHNTSP